MVSISLYPFLTRLSTNSTVRLILLPQEFFFFLLFKFVKPPVKQKRSCAGRLGSSSFGRTTDERENQQMDGSGVSTILFVFIAMGELMHIVLGVRCFFHNNDDNDDDDDDEADNNSNIK